MSLHTPATIALAVMSLAMPSLDRAHAADSAELPRYQFKVGQELTYHAQSEFKGKEGPPLRSEYTWQVWVVQHNDDGSWRLILRQSSLYEMPQVVLPAGAKGVDKPSKPSKSDRRGQSNQGPSPATAQAPAAPAEYVTFAYCNIFADGRIADNPTIDFRLEPRLLFPQLPKSEKELEKGWSDARRNTQITYRYRVAQRPDEDADSPTWEIRATRHSPIDEVLSSSTTATYLFDAQRGVVEGVESRLRQEYGPAGEGTNTTELTGTESFDENWTRQLREEMEIYFDVQDRYGELLHAAQRDSSETETLLLDAGALLHDAAGRVSLPLIKEQLNKQLAQHAMNAGLAARAARDRADLLDAPAPNFQLKDLEAKSHWLKNYKGKIVVLEFWQRGSDWCLRLVPQIEQIVEHFDEQPVVVLGMNVDAQEEDARYVAEKMALNYPTLRADKIAEKYGVKELPAVVVIDREGLIRDFRGGYSATLAKELIAEIESLLGNGKPDKKE